MATNAIKAMAGFWDGAAYTYDGDGSLAILDGDETIEPPGMVRQVIATVPLPSAITQRMMGNPALSLFDGAESPSDRNAFNNGFN